MKIIHTSDLHLDSPLTARLTSSKVRERKNELLLSFRKIVQNAKNSASLGFVIAGDLFDSEKVGKRTLKNVIDIIASCPEITFFYLSGNHERGALLDSCIPLPENLKLFENEWTYFKLGEVNIIGRCETSSDMFSTVSLNENEVNVIVLHGELRDRSDRGGVIGKKDAEELPIDYLALGHYHSYSKTEISRRLTAVYSGTPEGRGFDEIGPCGYVTLTVNGRSVSHTFTESAKRRLEIIEVDVTDSLSDVAVMSKIEKALRQTSRESLVRVRLVGSRELGRTFDTEALLSSLKDLYYYVEIKDESKLRICKDDFKNDISLKGEFIRSVLADSSLEDSEKEAVINMGLSVLME